MRKAFALVTALLLASCSGSNEEASNLTSYEPAESATDSAGRGTVPGVAPTAAPGVAFNYRYAFRLPASRIAAVQEQHAAACEKLGVSRCRITGMLYEQNGEDEVSAQLAFKLDPALARGFGRDGIAAVERAEGELQRAEIEGTDVGAQIDAGAREGTGITDELTRIEQRLAQPGLGAAERAELQRQAQQLRDSARHNQAQQTERRTQLASTPMVFDYRAGETGGPIAQAARDAAGTFASSLAALIVFALAVLPWAVLALLLWLILRWLNRRFPGARARLAPATEPVTAPAE